MLQLSPNEAISNGTSGRSSTKEHVGRTAIRVHRLCKQFPQRRTIPQLLRNSPVNYRSVLRDVSFHVNRGEVFGVLGTNGAGKTTLTRILCTMVVPDRGTVEVVGVDGVKHPLDVRKAVGYVTCADRSFEERISAIANLNFFATLNDLAGRERDHRVAEVLEQVDLWDCAHQAVREFSTGMKQKLAIARALLHQPQVLFLDEPTSGLDPLASDRFRHFLQQLATEQQRTIFLCTHMPEEIEQLCDRVLFLHRGVSVASGTLESIRKSVCSATHYEIVTRQSLSGAAIDFSIPGVTLERATVSRSGLQFCNRFRVQVRVGDCDSAVAAIIKRLVHQQIDIVECRKQEMTLAELYAALTDASSNEATRQGTDTDA
ncbi:MAG: ABC transporter ATP-binding protein [Synechococcus sp.]